MDTTNQFFEKLQADEFNFSKLAFPNSTSKWFIWMITYFKFNSIKSRGALDHKRLKKVKDLVYQLHLRHYMHNILFQNEGTPRSFMYQFVLSRTDEIIRLAVSAISTNNQMAFYMALRSQFEINAHTYYLMMDEEYAQRFHRSPEDRIKDKNNPELIKNIMTLMKKFEKQFPIYEGFYDYCSNYIHPNPSTILKYIRPKKKDEKIVVNTNYTFETSWYQTPKAHKGALEWFDYLLKLVEHFLRLFDDLDEKIEVDSVEVKTQTSVIGLFGDLSRRQEVFNLRAKMQGWSKEEYEKRHAKFLEKYFHPGQFEKYGLNAEKSKKDSKE